MKEIAYAVVWIILLAMPVLAAWRKQWWPLGIYAAGCLVFLFAVQQDHGGWDDLADIATLIVIVLPIYIAGTIVWIATGLFKYWRNSRRNNKP